MMRMLRRLALLAVCAATLSVPALARDHWRGHRSSVVVVVNGRHGYDYDRWRDDDWYGRTRWRACDLPPDLAWRYGCRPVVYRYRPYYYRPYYRPYYRSSGVTFVFRAH